MYFGETIGLQFTDQEQNCDVSYKSDARQSFDQYGIVELWFLVRFD
jgi:hypothetical protein